MTEATATVDAAATPSAQADLVGVTILGLGPVGQGVVRAALDDPRFEMRACVDPRPDRDEAAQETGFDGAVLASAEDVGPGPGLAILCTQSAIADIAPTIQTLLERGYDVVTSCEEMIAPQLGPASVVGELDHAAERANRTVVGAGVNPGFVMDYLPLIATMAARDVQGVRVLRRVDVGRRRTRLQEKVGMGISLEEFEQRRDAGTIGHVGLRASLVFLANALGWDGESQETVEPVVDAAGRTSRGVRHVAEVRDVAGEVRVRGLLEMYGGASEVDEIEVDGTPPAHLKLVGGVSGDEATVSAILNVGARVGQMEPGLKTLEAITPPAWHV